MSSSTCGVMRPRKRSSLRSRKSRYCCALGDVGVTKKEIPGVFSVQPVEHRREHTHHDGVVRADPDFADRRIGQELDARHRLAQVIEHGHSAIEQGATVLGRLDALAAAIEQPHADRVFKVRDRSRNGGLRGIEDLRRLAHAAGLHDRHQDVEVVQLYPASDAVAQLHPGTHCNPDIAESGNSIVRA